VSHEIEATSGNRRHDAGEDGGHERQRHDEDCDTGIDANRLHARKTARRHRHQGTQRRPRESHGSGGREPGKPEAL
jgi:hypothetical protein